MFSPPSHRWFSLFSTLLLVLTGLLPVSADAFPNHFSVGVQADCLGCAIAEQFPPLRSQLEGELPWTASSRRFGKRTVPGLAVTTSTDNHPPEGLKPLERQAWVAMAERGQMHLFLPQRYTGSTVVKQGGVQVQVQPLGAQPARAEQQGKTLVYRNVYPATDSLQIVKPGRSEEFLYLREPNAPQTFDYRVQVGQGVQVRSVGGSIAFVDSRGSGVRIERPWLMDSSGQRSESAVHWQVLDGGRRLRLVVEPGGMRYPLIVDPTWTTTGSMSVARNSHTATLLRNGKILVVAGFNGGGSYENSAELYDPQTGTWNFTGFMSTARAYHTATLLRNGKVLVAGGSVYDPEDVSSAELYDPQTGTWSTTGFMSTARTSHTATLLPSGKVLVAGGYNNGSYNDNAELYDPQTGTWSTTGFMSTARTSHTATLLPSGKVLVAGGYNNGSDNDSAELYDPQTGTWSITGSMSSTRFGHTATLLSNGKVLVVGGLYSYNFSLSSAELYDPQTGTWSTTGSMSTDRFYHTATLLPGGKVLVEGGTSNSSGISFSSAEVYNPQIGTWNTTASLNTTRYTHTATLLPNGTVVVAAGLGGSVKNYESITLNSAEVYHRLP